MCLWQSRVTSPILVKSTSASPNMLEASTALHLSNRLGFGPAQGDLPRIAGMGVEAFLDDQLHAQPAHLPPSVTFALRALPSFGKNSSEVYAEYWWRDQVDDPKSIPKDE